MKNTTLLLGLLLICGSLYGQDGVKTKNVARFGVNRAFFGSGDIVGTSIYGEYAYSFNEYFAIAPRLMSTNAHRKSEGYFQHASSFAISLSIRITPLPHSFRRLKVDLGGLYNKFINTHGEINEKTEYASHMSYWTVHSKEDLYGLIGSLNFNIFDTKRVEAGFRFDMLTSFTDIYFNCDSMQAGIYVGLKF
jgi:hypothetical protein